MYTIAKDIYRKRLLIDAYFSREEVNDQVIRTFFHDITTALGLKTYGDPIIHSTGGVGKAENQGYDGFVPLIDSGIYIAIWSNQRFLSIVMYTCKDFDETRAVQVTHDFFHFKEYEHKLF